MLYIDLYSFHAENVWNVIGDHGLLSHHNGLVLVIVVVPNWCHAPSHLPHSHFCSTSNSYVHQICPNLGEYKLILLIYTLNTVLRFSKQVLILYFSFGCIKILYLKIKSSINSNALTISNFITIMMQSPKYLAAAIPDMTTPLV